MAVVWEIQQLWGLYPYTHIPFLCIFKLLFWAHLQSFKRWLLGLSCLSAHLYGTSRLPPGRFSLNFIWEIFITLCQVEVWWKWEQKYQALYMKTKVVFVLLTVKCSSTIQRKNPYSVPMAVCSVFISCFMANAIQMKWLDWYMN